MFKLKYLKSVALGGVSAIVLTTTAFATEFNIPGGDLKSALDAYAAQARVSLIVSGGAIKDVRTRGAKGELTADVALSHILTGTGFVSYRNAQGEIGIMRGEAVRRTEQAFAQTAQAAPRPVAAAGIESVLVTAQKRTEDIQMVPIAVTALSSEQLDAMKIEGGPDLLKVVPNVTFSKNNFSGYNFSIRGIGTKAISVTTDPGVAVEFNNMALIRNRLFEQEYFDVERVEVLRGPQGTLHGRNATSGVINMISAKPNFSEFEGMIKGEVGNYQAKRLTAMLNVPLISDMLAIRFAGALTQRNGFGINLYDNSDIDNRDLWSARVTVGFNPAERIRTSLVWERFNEDDNRARTSKQLCTRDPGPTEVGGVPVPHQGADADREFEGIRGQFTQGCLPGSLYDKAAFGTPNGLAIPFVSYLEAIGVSGPSCEGASVGVFCYLIPAGTDPYGRKMQSTDLRAIYSKIKPRYEASADTLEFNAEFDVSDTLSVFSQTAYVRDRYHASQDYNRFTTVPTFFNTLLTGADNPIHNVAPNGVFCDPQLGCSDTIVGQDLSRARSTQFSQEFRVQSSFDGQINFSAGAHYTRYRTVEDYYVFFNGITYATVVTNAFPAVGGTDPSKITTNPDCSAVRESGFGAGAPDGLLCIPIEQSSIENIQDAGHNYFLSRNPYLLKSAAAFGEVYWQAADALKFTAGLRYTDDKKTFTPVPSETLLTDPARLVPWRGIFPSEFLDNFAASPLFSFGNGLYPALPPIERSWREVTGRFGADWRPDLDFTDQTMVYGFYSRGYKGGGMNPPRIGLNYDLLAEHGMVLAASAPPEFKPEFVNAYEMGAKNTLLGGAMILNADAFFYDYKDYQVSKIVDRTANNENFDARVWGFEVETLFSPFRNLRFNANLGYLDTRLSDHSLSIDVMNRTAGHSDWIVAKPGVTLTSNCIMPVSVASQLLEYPGVLTWDASAACPGGGAFGQNFTGKPGSILGTRSLPDGTFYDPADHPEANYGAGFYTDVSGRELPNSPHFTANVGAQYSREFLEHWVATLRADGYWQSQSWARVYELPIDKLHGWYNANLSVWVENDDGLKIEFYVKNILDGTPITDTFTNSDDTALTTNVFTLDPRLIGVSITKAF